MQFLQVAEIIACCKTQKLQAWNISEVHFDMFPGPSQFHEAASPHLGLNFRGLQFSFFRGGLFLCGQTRIYFTQIQLIMFTFQIYWSSCNELFISCRLLKNI